MYGGQRGFMLTHGQGRAAPARLRRRPRSTPVACASRRRSPEGDEGRRGRRARRAPAGPEEAARRHRLGRRADRRPAAASTPARTTSTASSTGPRLGGSPGSSFKPFALAAGLKDGFALKDTFDGNAPFVLPDGGGEVGNQGEGEGDELRLGDQPDHGDRELGQHGVRRPDHVDGRRARRRSSRWPTRSASRKNAPGLEALPGRRARLGHGQPDRHGQRLRDDRQRRASTTTGSSSRR